MAPAGKSLELVGRLTCPRAGTPTRLACPRPTR